MERNEKGQFIQERENIAGQKFGRLTAIEFSHKNANRKTFWVCECECGNRIVTRTDRLKSGRVKSCGCYKSEVTDPQNVKAAQASPKSHCQVQHEEIGPVVEDRLYTVWRSMKARCYYPNHKEYKRYGGRGIEVCDEWKNDFYSFWKWSNENGAEAGKDIHRIDNDGNYSPENCVYLPHKEHMTLHWQHRGN